MSVTYLSEKNAARYEYLYARFVELDGKELEELTKLRTEIQTNKAKRGTDIAKVQKQVTDFGLTLEELYGATLPDVIQAQGLSIDKLFPKEAIREYAVSTLGLGKTTPAKAADRSSDSESAGSRRHFLVNGNEVFFGGRGIADNAHIATIVKDLKEGKPLKGYIHQSLDKPNKVMEVIYRLELIAKQKASKSQLDDFGFSREAVDKAGAAYEKRAAEQARIAADKKAKKAAPEKKAA
ncbi:hypothetical protein AWB71_01326 [Caballeronia peredens]|nr:hypothetical protein AWB71_01326 [Caballeronia peredens]